MQESEILAKKTVFAQAKLLNLKQITTFSRINKLLYRLYLHKQSY